MSRNTKGRAVNAIVKRTAPLAAALLLAGCISFGPKLPDQLLSLTPVTTAPAGDLGAGSKLPPLTVLDPESERVLDVLRVPVQVTPSTIAYLKNAAWIEKPARQFRSLLAETIRAKSGRMVFEGLDGQQADRAVLTGRLSAMGYDAARGSVVVRFDALLSQPGGAVKSKRFEAEVPGVPAEAVAVAPALNKAANDVAAQVAEWAGP